MGNFWSEGRRLINVERRTPLNNFQSLPLLNPKTNEPSDRPLIPQPHRTVCRHIPLPHFDTCNPPHSQGLRVEGTSGQTTMVTCLTPVAKLCNDKPQNQNGKWKWFGLCHSVVHFVCENGCFGQLETITRTEKQRPETK